MEVFNKQCLYATALFNCACASALCLVKLKRLQI